MYKYVRTDETGWVLALKDDNKTTINLCEYTKTQFIRQKDDRTFFKICDGPNKDKIVSMSTPHASDHLSANPKDVPAQTEAVLTITYGKRVNGWYSKARGESLDQQMATMSFASKTVQLSLNSIWGNVFTPLPAGDFKIRIPDAPHSADMTSFYRKEAPSLKYDQVWFPIDYGNNTRYVHVGNLSEGCATVLDINKWADVYLYLIKHRTPSLQHVGKLVVKMASN